MFCFNYNMGKHKKKYNLVSLGKWESDTKKLSESLGMNPVYNHFSLDLNQDELNQDLTGKNRVEDLRIAAECHRQARRHLQSVIRPGMKYTDICETVEKKVVQLLGRNDLKAGMGFPVGISVNHIAAHDSANPADTRMIKEDDVVKIDFGTHVNGNIIDSAFMVAFNDKYTPLLEASKDGTWTGIKLAGPDVHLIDISAAIKEAIESYEIELDGKIYPIHAVKNLGGHNILPYHIHAGKTLLGAPDHMNDKEKMEINECYAIETFATTGETGMIELDLTMPTNHFKVHKSYPIPQHKFKVSQNLLTHLKKERSTLPFCTRWLERDFGTGYQAGLSLLSKMNVVEEYPPIIDKPGTYTSQWEHTIFIHDFGKEVLSQGDDY